MYLTMHRFAAVICVHAVRQLATLLGKFKLMNYESKWKLILYLSFSNTNRQCGIHKYMTLMPVTFLVRVDVGSRHNYGCLAFDAV